MWCRSRTRPIAVGEPGHVADVGQDPCRDDRPDSGQVHQRSATDQHNGLQLLGDGLDLFSTTTSSASCSAASRRRVFPARSRGHTEERMALT